MNFDPKFLVASLIFSAIGLLYFKRGKNEHDARVMVTGIFLLIYPYFIDQFWLLLTLGILGTGAPHVLDRISWFD